MQKLYLLGPVTWKVTRRNARKDIANLQIKRLNNYTMSQVFAWMITNSKRKKWDLLENCQTHALKLFSNACSWLVLASPIFYGL